MLIETLRMLISKLMLEKKEHGKDFEVLFYVYNDNVIRSTCPRVGPHGPKYCGVKGCEESQLINDLKLKHLPTIQGLQDVEPQTFRNGFLCES